MAEKDKSEKDKSEKDKGARAVVIVDDTVITREFLDYYAGQRQQRSPNAPPAGRQQLIEDLITTSLLANELDRLLDKEQSSPDAQLHMRMQLMDSKARVLVSNNILVSDEEIEGLYKERFEGEAVESYLSMEYHTRHILLKSEEEALTVTKQLDDGADFAELAREKSQDKGSGSKGGDIGWYKPDSLVPPYSEAMQSLKVGERTDKPVQSQFGWHIIELLSEPRKSALPTLAEQTRSLKNEIFNTKLTRYVSELRRKAEVRINVGTD